MTPQEQQLLQDLTARINQTTLPEKDPEAEQFLNQSLGRNPDALYILAQTVLVQNYALDQAKQQIAQARQQAAQPEKHTSFLGNLLGLDNKPTPPPPPQAQYAPVQNTGYPQQPQYAQPQYVQPGYPPQQQPSGLFGGGTGMGGGGSFLRSAATTAAGVAAGAIAFEGIESLMHGFGNHAGYGQSLGGFGEGQPREEIVNNYYGDSDRGDRGDRNDLSDRFAAAGDSPSDDIEDRRGFSSADSDTDADSNDDPNDSADNFTDDSGSDSSSDFGSDDNS